MEEIHAGQIYRHFKNKYYIVLTDIAIHTETGERFVVYKRLDEANSVVYVRPFEMFIGNVNAEKYPLCAGQKRFQLVGSV